MVKQDQESIEYNAVPHGWNPNRKSQCSESFTQEVTFYSEGQRWPGNVQFVCVFGNDLKNTCGPVYQGQKLVVKFTAPEKPGRYFATYRLKANGEEFGDKLYLNLAVEAPAPVQEVKQVKEEPQGSSLLDSAFVPPNPAEKSP